MVQNVLMPNDKKKKTTGGRKHADNENYRKPATMVRIREALADAAEPAAELLAQSVTQFVNDAVREKLERMGRWPLPEVKKLD